MLRSVILAAARSSRLERLVETAPLSRDIVRRFIAGSTTEDALRVAGELAAAGLTVSLDYLGEDTAAPEDAVRTRDEYLSAIAALAAADSAAMADPLGPAGSVGVAAVSSEQTTVERAVAGPASLDVGAAEATRTAAPEPGLRAGAEAGTNAVPALGTGLSPKAEVSVKLSALGQRFDERLAVEHARAICAAAQTAGLAVTLDMEDHATTDSTLEILATLRSEYPTTGAVLQAYLRRTEADCRELATPGSRVRLCKGAYAEPESVAYQSKLDVDRSYVRCLNILMAGGGYPMLATHDPRLVAIGEDRARWFDRSPREFEFQMLFGVRPDEQRRLATEGYTVRVYVPYGTQSYGYLLRRLAERPTNLAFFIRSVSSRR